MVTDIVFRHLLCYNCPASMLPDNCKRHRVQAPSLLQLSGEYVLGQLRQTSHLGTFSEVDTGSVEVDTGSVKLDMGSIEVDMGPVEVEQ